MFQYRKKPSINDACKVLLCWLSSWFFWYVSQMFPQYGNTLRYTVAEDPGPVPPGHILSLETSALKYLSLHN